VSIKRVALATLGCRVNQAESDSLAEQFQARGYQVVRSHQPADVFILNSCTVTHVADRKSRQVLRQAKRANPNALIAVTGCYAQMGAGEVAAMLGVDLVVGNGDKPCLVDIIEEAIAARPVTEGSAPGGLGVGPSSPSSFALPAATILGDSRLGGADYPATPRRTRALIKIQDGCDNFCTYCIVPKARGPRRSVPVQEVVDAVQEKVGQGYAEVVLTGVHAGAYGQEPGSPTAGVDLAGLVQRILMETNVRRLRLSSIEPWDFRPHFLALWESPRLCRHLHLPLQSGSDTTLQRMGRRYSAGMFRELVGNIRSAIPEVAITTDVMVGFPGETEADHAESLRFCTEIGFAGMHVFQYSRREGTPAARLPRQVVETVKKRRSEEMLALAASSAARFRQRFLGHRALILWEGQTGTHGPGPEHAGRRTWEGLTDNYLRVYAEAPIILSNQLSLARLVAEWKDGLWGELEGALASCA